MTGVSGGQRAPCCPCSPSPPPAARAANASPLPLSPTSRPIKRWPVATRKRHRASPCLIPRLPFPSPRGSRLAAALTPRVMPWRPCPRSFRFHHARVTACSGIDALAHALETLVTKVRTPLSLIFSREAFRLAIAGLPRVLASPADLEARGWMLLGAAWAGTAIENSMLGAAHAAANPLTAHFGVVHGHAVGLMLPHVMRLNAREYIVARAYAEMACAAQLALPSEAPEAAAEHLAARLESLLELARLPRNLKHCGAKPEDIPRLADEAARQWTAQFNPRPVTASDFQNLYTAALTPA